jgi:flavin-dependent dehydrogenase
VESLECEVLVIGGRIAGSVLAAVLGEAHRGEPLLHECSLGIGERP